MVLGVGHAWAPPGQRFRSLLPGHLENYPTVNIQQGCCMPWFIYAESLVNNAALILNIKFAGSREVVGGVDPQWSSGLCDPTPYTSTPAHVPASLKSVLIMH